MITENRRILIIDDERPILMTLEALLGRHGYHPEVAANASTGMRLLQSKPPALVLLDLQLPDADGLQMLEQIKVDHPDTQVIILTAHDSLNNAIESIKRGAYHFISKPYAPEELLSLVEKALEKQSLLRETIELRQTAQNLKQRLAQCGDAAGAGFQEQGDAANRRFDYGNGAFRGQRAHYRRERGRQGSHRQCDSQPKPASGEADGETQLLGVSANDDRRRTVWLHEGRLHRGDE